MKNFFNEFIETLSEVPKANVLLFSVGISLGLLAVFRSIIDYQWSPLVLLGMSIFTVMISLTEIGNSKKKSGLLFFLSVPFALFTCLILYVFDASSGDIQLYSESFTILSLGIIIASLGVKISD